MSFWNDWAPRATATFRRASARREKQRLAKGGRALAPVEPIRGHTIARTFWGKSWCTNLERYSDLANRLPRGRSYVRSGSVVHLAIGDGVIEALVSGSSLYEVTVSIATVPKADWKAICRDSSGSIHSLVELLDGKLSNAMMERLCRKEGGLFPRPKDMQFDCSCPDGAWMCKHVAAVLYGVGARLDSEPALLFRLRRADENDLIAGVAQAPATRGKGARGERKLERKDLSALFGIELASGPKKGATREAKPPVKEKRAPMRKGPKKNLKKRRRS